MIEQAVSANRATAFHTAFVSAYVKAARLKYVRLASLLPYHGQDVHIIHGGNRWWQIVCIPGQRAGDVHLGPVGIFTQQFADPVIYPDLADLPDLNSSRREEFRLAMNVDFFIYHEAYAPPEPPGEDALAIAATALAERLVDEHAAPLVELELLKTKLSSLRNSHQLLDDMREARDCMRTEHYRAGIVTCCAAAESALVGRLEEMGHPIRQEERGRVLGHEHHSFPVMVQEAYRSGAITSKTRDRLDLLNGLRRGVEHCRPDATAQDDAAYAWQSLEQLLREFTK
jgi:hypothetical protein